jgi:hypothetical protein
MDKESDVSSFKGWSATCRGLFDDIILIVLQYNKNKREDGIVSHNTVPQFGTVLEIVLETNSSY